MPSSKSSLASLVAALPPERRKELIRSLSPEEAEALRWEWRFWARPEQLEPTGASWRFWLILAGRGFGKTRTGAEWVCQKVERGEAKRIALVAETAADARDVMVEGESGILAVAPPWNRPTYQPSRRRLTWYNPDGSVRAIATTYSAEEPDQLRGPQHDLAWADEPAKWRFAQATWDQLLFGLRLGTNPRACLTTTPRPIPLIKSLLNDPLCAVTRGSTYDNRENLAPQFLEAILKRFEGTRLGRQELSAEVLDDAPGALWSRDHIDQHCRTTEVPELVRVVVAVDPNVSSGDDQESGAREQDGVSTAELGECGIVVAGLGADEIVYVLGDYSLVRPTPEQWGREAVASFHRHEADRIVGEVNNGGDLVESNVRAIERQIPFRQVRASRGKQVRAEPVASLYEQARVKHVGMFPLLEDQMCQWEPGVSTWSPNRVDALVWAITELTERMPAVTDAYGRARARFVRRPRARE